MFHKTILFVTLFLINAHSATHCDEPDTKSSIKNLPACMQSQEFRSSLRYVPLLAVNTILLHGIAKGSVLMPPPLACAQIAAYTLIMLFQDEIKSTTKECTQKVATCFSTVKKECAYTLQACTEQATDDFQNTYITSKPKIQEALDAAQKYLEKKGTRSDEPIDILGL